MDQDISNFDQNLRSKYAISEHTAKKENELIIDIDVSKDQDV